MPVRVRKVLSERTKVLIVVAIAVVLVGVFVAYDQWRRWPYNPRNMSIPLNPDGTCPPKYTKTLGLAAKPFCCADGVSCD